VLLKVSPFLVGGFAVFGLGTLRAPRVEEGAVGAHELVIEDRLWRRGISQLSECPFSLGRSAVRSPSCHRFGPRDMPVEAQRSRHRAVAIPEVPYAVASP
jgi:hypothetical protein